MGEIIPFPARKSPKFGFERASKRRKENPDQLSLFSSGPGQVLRLPTSISPFEEALLLDERDDDRAVQAYQRAITEGDHIADAYCNLGILESKAGRLTKAFDCFTRALEQDPRHFEAHYNLGNLYFEQDDICMARLHYELASEISPAFPNLYFNLGLVLVLSEEKEKAIDALLKFEQLAQPEESRNADELIREIKKALSQRDRSGGANGRPTT